MKIKLLLILLLIISFITTNYAQSPGGTSQTTNVWIKENSGTTPSTGTGTLTNWTNNGISGAVTVNGSPDFDENGYNFNPKIHFKGNGNFLAHTGLTYGAIYAIVELKDLSRVYTLGNP